ncbi:hypothetical protein, partial [Stenotrophomonas sp. MA5]|uniref:hypothetical protein n=1 Tax=Stenotrophomonas sp. MA5 TaxID=2508572 RepID=UPI0019D6CA97
SFPAPDSEREASGLSFFYVVPALDCRAFRSSEPERKTGIAEEISVDALLQSRHNSAPSTQVERNLRE